VIGRSVAFLLFVFFAAPSAWAQSPSGSAGNTVVCESKAGERNVCPANTSSGVALTKPEDASVCLLGKTWGYDDKGVWVSDGCGGEFALGQAARPKHFGTYTPDGGFTLVNTEHGTVVFRAFTYVRYLDQKQLDQTYTNYFGQTSPVKLRQDIQLNKVLLYFLGWVITPKLHYLTYIWTSNVSQGQSAQVVVAGNVSYSFNDHLTVGAGIASLPGVRSTEANFPYWLGEDNRTIADEFFRPSYTTAIFATGSIIKGLDYRVMLGNNLSQLGIDAGQLDNGLNTVSSSLAWMPTTGEFGPSARFGDFADHQKMATRVAVHYTESDENSQSQPTNDSFDNVQLRLSDGSVVFQPGLFGPGIAVNDVTYHMFDFDGGVKYRGFALEGEYYKRWLDNFRGPGTSGLPTINDNGYQMQASAMVVQKTVGVYTSHSAIFGHYGNPWDTRVGINWYPWKTEGIRFNAEYIQLHRSPVGGLTLPYPVGGNGPLFSLNFQLYF
jgi:Protein of unknown function (DUF3011)